MILTYHNISDGREHLDEAPHPFKLRPAITAQQFELHLRILKKSYNVVSLEEGVKWLKGGKELKNNLAVITFDDGYESFYTLAFPLLKKYDFPATVFLPTDFINQKKIFWWDELTNVFFHFDSKTLPSAQLIPIIGEKLVKQVRALKNDTKRKMQFLHSLESYLRSIEDQQREEKIERIKEILPLDQDVKSAELKTLSWGQIAEMSRGGISFGSHTCSHLNIGFASLEKIEEELAKSKESIETNVKVKVISFAYPYSADFETHLRVKPILDNLEYECACTCLTGVNLSNSDPFFLKRMTLPMTTYSSIISRELFLSLSGKSI
jgi:peptidoglycan/xylan/chitin deacetylase (PgdA/CDA1 family)